MVVLRYAFFLIGIVGSILSCQKPRASQPLFYTEQGAVWAYGRVELAASATPADLFVSRNPSVASGENETYELFRAVNASSSQQKETVYYADRSIVSTAQPISELLLFAFDYRYQPRAGAEGVVDVWAYLRKGGQSQSGKKEVWLGSAQFSNGVQVATLSRAPGLLLSSITQGVKEGAFALHFVPLSVPLSVEDLKKQCQGRSLVSGQIRPGTESNSNCTWLSVPEDVCEGSPLSDACRPPLPPASSNTNITTQVEFVNAIDKNVYELSSQGQMAVVTFGSDASVKEEELQQKCYEDFFVVARTLGERSNSSCKLGLASSAFDEKNKGKLRCRVSVRFDQPISYSERICNVVAFFKSSKQSTAVQFLAK